jgi:hypothetical protein
MSVNIAGVSVWIVIASTAAMGQQRDDRAALGPSAPTERVVVRSNPFGGALPSRTVETRRDSGGSEVVTETLQSPDIDGRLVPTRETSTETTRTGPTTVQTRRDVFEFGASRQRMLVETTESARETLPDGSVRTVVTTQAPDINGHLGLTVRQIEHTTSIAPDVRQTDIAVFRPGLNGALQESERLQQTERQVTPDVLRKETTWFVRDLNGRFQPTETRIQDVRTTGPSERVEEETAATLDINGKLTVSERSVTHHVEANGQKQTVTETYSRNLPGVAGSDSRLELSHRVRTTTTSAADEGGQTVEEVEQLAPGSPNDPMRLAQRTVATTRKISADQWKTDRQVLVPDANGRLAVASDETGDAITR